MGKNCILSSKDGNSVFAITDEKLYVPIVTFLAEHIVKLSKLLGGGFKRPIYWNQYKVIYIYIYIYIYVKIMFRRI